MKKQIIESNTEPNKNCLWLTPNGLKRYGKSGWEDLTNGLGNGGNSGSGGNNNVFKIAFHMNDDIEEIIVCDRIIKYGSVTQNGSYTVFQSFEEDDINYIKNCIETATICRFNMLTYNQNLGFGYLPIASTFTNDEYNLKAFIWYDDKFYNQIDIVINNQEAYIKLFGG